MLTTPYGLRPDYVTDGPVDAVDLNRRARILNAQLPGALRAATLGAGVFPLLNEVSSSLEILIAAASAAFLVTLSGATVAAAAGGAAITHPAGALVFTQSAGLSVPLPTLAAGETAFVHLLLQIPQNSLALGAADSLTGSAPILKVSELEIEEGGLLLASLRDGVLTDRRNFTAPVLLALSLLQTQSDIGYSTAARKIGPIGARLLKLETGDGANVGEVTRVEFNALKTRVAALETALPIAVASLRAELLDAIATGGRRPMQTPLDQVFHELSIVRQIAGRDQLDQLERSQSANILRGENGVIYGDGTSNHPDFLGPTTLTLDPATGYFEP